MPKHVFKKLYRELEISVNTVISTKLERYSNECRKTKTKVITLANQKGQRQSSRPIKTRSNCTQPSQSTGKCARPSHDLFWFHF